MVRQREAALEEALNLGNEAPTFTEPLPAEDDVEEMDIEVPGWEAKGQWVLSLDLGTGEPHLGFTRSTQLTRPRLHKALHLSYVLPHTPHVLRPTNSYHAGFVHDNPIICQASHRVHSISKSHP